MVLFPRTRASVVVSVLAVAAAIIAPAPAHAADTTPPTITSIGFVEAAGSFYSHPVGATMYVNPAQSGSFDAVVDATDDTGIAYVDFDGQQRNYSSPWHVMHWWQSNHPGAGSRTVTVMDLAGNSSTGSYVIATDEAAPTGGTLTAVEDPTGAALTFDSGADTGAGIGSTRIQRRTAPHTTPGTCGVFGAWFQLGPAGPTSPWTDTWVPADSCAQYRLVVRDNVGNEAITRAPGTVGTAADRTEPVVEIDAAVDPLRGTVTLTGLATDDGSGVASVDVDWGNTAFPTAHDACSTTVVASSSWTCTWNTAVVDVPDGRINLVATASDEAGNVSEVSVAEVVVDNHLPTAAVSRIVEATNPYGQHAVGNTLYYSPADSGSGTIEVTSLDGIGHADTARFPALGAGWIGSHAVHGTTGVMQGVYTWSSNAAVIDADAEILVTDAAGNTTTAPFHVRADATAPAGATIDVTGTIGDVDIAFTAGTDGADGSGVATRRLQRRDATETAGRCDAFGPWLNIGATSAPSPFTDDFGVADRCYQYRVVVTDNVGNQMSVVADGTIGGGALDYVAPLVSIDAAPVGPLQGSATLTGTTSDLAGPVARVTVSYDGDQDGTACVATNPVTTWSCTWDTTAAPDGRYTLRAVATDASGNDSDIATRTIVVDNHLPTITDLQFDVPGGMGYAAGSMLYITTNRVGAATLVASTLDGPGGRAELVRFQTEFRQHYSVSSTPPFRYIYVWSQPSQEIAGARTVTAVDAAGNEATAEFTIVIDNEAPIGASIATDWNDGQPRVAVDPGVDAVSGVGRRRVSRRESPFDGTDCGPWSSWVGVHGALTDPSFDDVDAPAGRCLQYQVIVADRIGTAVTVTGPIVHAPVAAHAPEPAPEPSATQGSAPATPAPVTTAPPAQTPDDESASEASWRMRAAIGGWTPWRAGEAGAAPKPGSTTCVEADGDASCTSEPLDDRDLGRGGAWRLTRDAAAHDGTRSIASAAGATLTTKVAADARVSLVARTCADCGTLRVLVGTRQLALVSLRAAKGQARRSFRLPKLPGSGTATLRIVAGPRANVDAVIVDRAD